MANLIKVACRVPNGIMLNLWKEGFDDGTGYKPQIHDGPGVRLNGLARLSTGVGATERDDLPPGETMVDEEWFGRWLAQEAESPLVTMKQVYRLDEEADQNPTP